MFGIFGEPNWQVLGGLQCQYPSSDSPTWGPYEETGSRGPTRAADEGMMHVTLDSDVFCHLIYKFTTFWQFYIHAKHGYVFCFIKVFVMWYLCCNVDIK